MNSKSIVQLRNKYTAEILQLNVHWLYIQHQDLQPYDLQLYYWK